MKQTINPEPPDFEEPDERKPIFAEERKQWILSVVSERGRVKVADLASLAGVTDTTIRKDLSELDHARLLRRTHGGAMAIRPAYEPHVDTRVAQNAAEKSRIARACLLEIKDGDAVYIDSGTTTGAIATLLGSGRTEFEQSVPHNVNVLTNALEVARVLENVPTVWHTVLGGQYRSMGGCFVGPLAVASMHEFTLNTAFIGVSGITESGVTVSNASEAQLKSSVMDQARRVILPVVHTKLGATDFAKICDLDRIDMIIADESNDYLRELCARNGIELVVAGNGGNRSSN